MEDKPNYVPSKSWAEMTMQELLKAAEERKEPLTLSLSA
jgi:hypothetical protein